LADRVKYKLEVELNHAWAELDKIENPNTAQFNIIAENHQPTTSRHIFELLTDNEDEGRYFINLIAQPGRSVKNVIQATVVQWLTEQLYFRYQQKIQQEEMEKLRPKIEIAPSNLLPSVDELSERRRKR